MREKDRSQPETLRFREVTPSLTATDLEKSLVWYQTVMGFTVQETFRDEERRLVGAVLIAGAVRFFLGQDDFAAGRDRVKGVGFRLFCVTAQDVDELADAIVARGGVLTEQPQDRPWGARDFAVVDPDGFTISVTSPTTEG